MTGKEHQVTCAEALLAAPPAIPASSAVAQQLPKTCPKVVDKLTRKPRFDNNSAELGRIRADSGRF